MADLIKSAGDVTIPVAKTPVTPNVCYVSQAVVQMGMIGTKVSPTVILHLTAASLDSKTGALTPLSYGDMIHVTEAEATDPAVSAAMKAIVENVRALAAALNAERKVL